jgi:hypothetical protein
MLVKMLSQVRVDLKLLGVWEEDIEGVVPEVEDILDHEVEDFPGDQEVGSALEEAVAILGDVVKFAKE